MAMLHCLLIICSTSIYCYRFEKEFTVKEVLGQGAFGVVFHVKSMFDRGEYALKLTKLPDE